MHNLILIRHSQPEIESNVPSALWHLSKIGRDKCAILAEKLAPYGIRNIVSSQEPKAIDTAQIIASILGATFCVGDGLIEHDRSDETFIDREQFEEQVARFFDKPIELVFGNESADQAHRRFALALMRVIAEHRDQNIAVVTHGTVMTLFVSRAVGLEPFTFWKELGLPSFVVLTLPSLEIVTVQKSV